jgi:hypothetical protein
VIAAPEGLCALFVEDADGETIQSTSPVAWLDSSSPCPAIVLDDDGKPVSADTVEGFAGLTWRHRVIAALPGGGWSLALNATDRLPIQAWLVRADGHMLAAAVGQFSAMTFDPVDDDITFVPPGDAP